ncbi:MAG: (E)-4-hydroxy-3-methylbut-2-enyl-diphosphate synthase [Planctomycetota bacterium]
MSISRRATKSVRAGAVTIGGGNPVVVQSMCATKTHDAVATARLAEMLREAGAGLVRVAVDSDREAAALPDIRRRTSANLVVDLQENYRMAEKVAPYVDKLRYNPGHLHHHEKEKPVREKVSYLVGVARKHDLAIRIGVNCGSVDPEILRRFGKDHIGATVESALQHCGYMDELGFDRYVVSIKDSDPAKVVEANRRFAAARPGVPLHLGVTEAGLPPEGIGKTREAFEPLLAEGIGDTLRVSLTLPAERKTEEVRAGLAILADVAAGRFRAGEHRRADRINIISCPSCSRVENARFVDLAEKIRDITADLRAPGVTVAVMGCRVNGPGETDDADLGLWCGPTHVNLKRGGTPLGAFPYDDILPRFRAELAAILAGPKTVSS